eukprot:sb/3473561/
MELIEYHINLLKQEDTVRVRFRFMNKEADLRSQQRCLDDSAPVIVVSLGGEVDLGAYGKKGRSAPDLEITPETGAGGDKGQPGVREALNLWEVLEPNWKFFTQHYDFKYDGFRRFRGGWSKIGNQRRWDIPSVGGGTAIGESARRMVGY